MRAVELLPRGGGPACADPPSRRPLDLAALLDDLAGALRMPGVRVRSGVRACGDDRALRSALREVLRAVAAALPAGEEVVVSASGVGPEPVFELSAAIAVPADLGAIARALLAPYGGVVEEDAAPGRGWRLRVAPPAARAVAVQAAGSDALV